MEAIGQMLFVVGLVVSLFLYLYIVFWSFKVSISASLFCLIITPIYTFISVELRQDRKIKPVLPIFIISSIACLSSVFFI